MPDFHDKVAIVTGGSRGIGHAIAQRLVSAGAKVCVTGRDPERLANAVAQLGGAEVAIGASGENDDATHREAAVRQTLDRFGAVDILVNNVGVGLTSGSVIDADLDLFRKTAEINVIATLGWSQLAWGGWMRDHGGVILNITSLSGLVVFPNQSSYTVTKAAVEQLTRQLALDLAPGVRVNSIAPAVTRTDAATDWWKSGWDELLSRYPLGRIGEPEDIAAAAAFLLSNDAAWITGSTLVVDGGHLMHRAGQ
jgi:3-oxoacyl-[acyl-carrier protein] reductase